MTVWDTGVYRAGPDDVRLVIDGEPAGLHLVVACEHHPLHVDGVVTWRGQRFELEFRAQGGGWELCLGEVGMDTSDWRAPKPYEHAETYACPGGNVMRPDMAVALICDHVGRWARGASGNRRTTAGLAREAHS